MPEIKHAIYKNGEIIMHRPPFKVLINNFLRLLQFWTKNKYVIKSIFMHRLDGRLVINEFQGYAFGKVEHKYYLPKMYNEKIQRQIPQKRRG